MKRIAMMGLFVLVPSALFLNYLAADENFGNIFYSVQAVELTAGAVNIFWMAQNMRTGFMLSGRISRKKSKPA